MLAPIPDIINAQKALERSVPGNARQPFYLHTSLDYKIVTEMDVNIPGPR